MNARAWLILSLGANVALAAAMGWQVMKKPATAAVPEAPYARASAKAAAEREKPRQFERRVAQSDAAAATNSADAAALPRLWERVEVADYKAYVANLRAIGMPEGTIRDIVMLDLFRSFGEQMTELIKDSDQPFWQSRHSWEDDEPSLITNEVKMAIGEFLSLSRQLLGVEPGQWIFDQCSWMFGAIERHRDFDAVGDIFSIMDQASDDTWLPPDRLRGLAQLRTGFKSRISDLRDKMGGTTNEVDRDAIQKQIDQMEEEQEKAEEDFLTPAERREKELREDSGLQMQLASIDVSRVEYEKLHDLTSSNTNRPWLAANTPEQAQAIAILGSERYEEFRRGSDGRYQELARLCREKKLTTDTLHALDDVRRACRDSVKDGSPIIAAREAATAKYRSILGDEQYKKIQGNLEAMLPRYRQHTLRLDESLDDLAKKNNTTAARILQENGVTSAAQLQPGQVINIPPQ